MVMWYYVDGAHVRQGPLGAEALAEAFRRGQVRRESLVWREGMAQWEPLEAHLAELPLPAPATPPVPPPVAGAAPAHAPAPAAAGIDRVQDAGFLRRLGAYIIDGLLLGSAYYVVLMVGSVIIAVMAASNIDGETVAITGGVMLVLAYALMSYFYYVGMERSKLQATVGKLALGIKVVDAGGRRLGWGKASARWAGSLLSYATLYIGFFMAGWTRRKQALHDLVAGTYVVDKWAYSEQPGRQGTGINGAVVAVLVVVMGLVAVAVVAVLAAIALPAYQDYVTRTHVAAALAEGRGVAVQVDEFKANTDRCPRDLDELGLGLADSPEVRVIRLVEPEEGYCDLVVVLSDRRELRSAAGGALTLQDDGDGSRSCTAEDIPDRYLPEACR